jgi:type IV pilus assembly protein PilO
MKFNPRERIMLYILAVLVILAAGYFLMIKPQLDKIDVLDIDKIALEEQIKSLDTELASSSMLDTNISEIKTKIEEMTKPFYPEILKDKIIMILEGIIQRSGIVNDVTNFEATMIKAVELVTAGTTESITFNIREYADRYNALVQPEQTDTGTDTAVGNASTVPAAERKLESMMVNLQINGTYEQIINFIREVELLNRTIVINNFLSVAGEPDETTGVINQVVNIEIVFYAIPKIFEQDADYYIWP